MFGASLVGSVEYGGAYLFLGLPSDPYSQRGSSFSAVDNYSLVDQYSSEDSYSAMPARFSRRGGFSSQNSPYSKRSQYQQGQGEDIEKTDQYSSENGSYSNL